MSAGTMTAPATEEYDHLYKIILVGDAAVGKTHLLTRYIRGTLPRTPQSTIGVEFATRTVPLQVGGTVKAQIWDTAGQERYRSIASAHYRRAVGALLVYDVTKLSTFINASKWLEELRQSGEPDIVIILVGNKADLPEDDPSLREVPSATAAALAQRHGLFFAEASAVSSLNVKKIFEDLLQEIYNQKTKNSPNQLPGTYDDFGVGGSRGHERVGGMQLAAPLAAGQGPPNRQRRMGGDTWATDFKSQPNPFSNCC